MHGLRGIPIGLNAQEIIQKPLQVHPYKLIIHNIKDYIFKKKRINIRVSKAKGPLDVVKSWSAVISICDDLYILLIIIFKQEISMIFPNDSGIYKLMSFEIPRETFYVTNPLSFPQFYFVTSLTELQKAISAETQNQPTTPQNNNISQRSPCETRIELCERQNKITSKAKIHRKRNLEKQLESAKKNSESNIVNQLYSFFNSYEKSETIVDRAIKCLKIPAFQLQKIRAIFYNIVRLINYKRGRKYVNKNSIYNYYTPQNFIQEMPEICSKLEEIKIITLEQLCFIFRVSTFYFLKTISPMAILTSKRISVPAKLEHLKRRRRVLSFNKTKIE